ncbi:MAG: hypothetical protein KDI55_00330 [Anaerolineae bacterium]|nr:hypothetical protein [Anaerolineae bacterium]
MSGEQGRRPGYRGRRVQVRSNQHPSGYVEKREPWHPLPREIDKPPCFDDYDIEAIQAVFAGTATKVQQQRAMGWILYVTGMKDMLYRSGGSDVRDFVLGRHSVGTIIMILRDINLSALRSKGKTSE